MTARPIPRTHPLTGEPLEPLGIVGGRTVWPILGGSQGPVETPPAAPAAPATADPLQAALVAAQQPAQPAPQPPATPAAPPAAPTPQPPAQPATTPKAVEVGETDDAGKLLARYTPEELAQYALSLRKENTRSRTDAKRTAAEEATAAAYRQMGVQLGLVKADDTDAKVTPELLQQQKAASDARATAAAVKLALYEQAAQHGGTPGELLSLLVLRDTTDLDPEAPDFAAKVVAAAQAAVTANPVLKAAPAQVVPVVPKSGAEFTGGPGHTSQPPTTMEEAVRIKMGV